MLFAIKRRWLPSLLLLGMVVALALTARQVLELRWRMMATPDLGRAVALGLGLVLASDATLHGVLCLALKDRYRSRYDGLAAYFRRQRAPEIIAGGLLAGGEELLFRGVILEAAMARAGAPVALVASSLAFGAAHALRDPRLAPFAFWAVWEGLLLGGLYLATGSLLALVLIHVAHDIIGFALFARRRRSLVAAPSASAL